MDRESALICDNCGGKLEVDPNNRLARCPFCGTCFSVSGLLGESEDVKIERIRGDIELGRQNVELGRQSIEAQRLRLEEMEALRSDPEQRAKAFKKSGLSKVTMIFAVISILTSLLAFVPNTPFHSVGVGIVAAIQAIFYLVTFFLGMQVIPQKGKNLHILTFVLGVLLMIPFSVSCFSCVSNQTGISEEKDETFSWSEIVLSDKIPSLESENGHIWDNTKNRLQLNVYNIPIKQYYSFVENCKTMGYTIESTENEEDYLAFNQDGYKLSLHYSILHDGEVDIEINAPKQLSEFVFPDSDLAKLIPVPKSNIGEIADNSENRLLIYVGKMPKESYNAYIDECAEKGFTIDLEKSENSYNAKNADGFKLYVTYNGNENIEISLYAPEKKEPENSAGMGSSSAVSSSSEDSNTISSTIDPTTIRPEIKEGLDSYAAFMDEYVVFLKKYTQSTNPLEMLSELSKYTEKLEEFEEKWDNIDDSDWTPAELAYYNKVMTEISMKMLEAY